jgi:serine protease Do
MSGRLGKSIWAVLLGVTSFAHAGDDDAALAKRLDSHSLPALEQRVCGAARLALPSVVAIRELKKGEAAKRRQLGSGVIISGDGLVLSQYHVTHMLDMNEPGRSRKIGEHLEVILQDGRQCDAELLGADRTYDLSLIRLVKPTGPFPFSPLDETAVAKLGDGILKLGHPVEYRPGRDPAVRLGRVLCAHENLMATDCLVAGGDSGGPYFDCNASPTLRHAAS